MEFTSLDHFSRMICCSNLPQDPAFFYTGHRFPPIDISGQHKDHDSPDEQELFEVRIIDNDYNTYQEVMEITRIALNITEEQAFAVAWEVDHRGSCVVAHGPYSEAESVADVIRTIGIEVQVNPVVQNHA